MPVNGRARVLLDSAIVAASIGVVSRYFLVQRLWGQSDISLSAKIVGIA